MIILLLLILVLTRACRAHTHFASRSVGKANGNHVQRFGRERLVVWRRLVGSALARRWRHLCRPIPSGRLLVRMTRTD